MDEILTAEMSGKHFFNIISVKICLISVYDLVVICLNILLSAYSRYL